MSNELLFIITTVVNFAMVLLFFRFFREKGIYAWVALATVIANIEVIKCCDIFGMAVTLGNVVYGSLFLCTDILSELYGKAYAKRAVMLGFFALVSTTVMMQLSLLFTPNENDFASPALHTIFSLSPRICLTSIVCFVLSNSLDVRLYEWFSRRAFPLWMKNNSATFIAQTFDTIAFSFVAFVGIFPIPTIIELIITTMVIKVVIAAMDTPFLYAATGIHKRYHQQAMPAD